MFPSPPSSVCWEEQILLSASPFSPVFPSFHWLQRKKGVSFPQDVQRCGRESELSVIRHRAACLHSWSRLKESAEGNVAEPPRLHIVPLRPVWSLAPGGGWMDGSIQQKILEGARLWGAEDNEDVDQHSSQVNKTLPVMMQCFLSSGRSKRFRTYWTVSGGEMMYSSYITMEILSLEIQ